MKHLGLDPIQHNESASSMTGTESPLISAVPTEPLTDRLPGPRRFIGQSSGVQRPEETQDMQPRRSPSDVAGERPSDPADMMTL